MSKHHHRIGWRIAAWECGYKTGLQRRLPDPLDEEVQHARGLLHVYEAGYAHGRSVRAQLQQQGLWPQPDPTSAKEKGTETS